jgi:hypothetical protein
VTIFERAASEPRRISSASAATTTSGKLYKTMTQSNQWAFTLVATAIEDDEWIANIVAWRHVANPGQRRFEVANGQLRSL